MGIKKIDRLNLRNASDIFGDEWDGNSLIEDIWPIMSDPDREAAMSDLRCEIRELLIAMVEERCDGEKQ